MKMINERLASYGVGGLETEEILAIITGIDVFKLKEYINDYGANELIKVKDSLEITTKQKKKLELVYSLIHKVNMSGYKTKHVLNSSQKAGEFFINDLKFFKDEVFKMALLDTQQRIITVKTVAEGSIDQSVIHIRNVVKTILDNNAKSIIMAHNHPGGSLNPSEPDIQLTKHLQTTLKLLNVNINDHVIIADNRYTSFAEQGLL